MAPARPTGTRRALGAFVYNPRFSGQIYDKESNLHYNYFRDYDPRIGRHGRHKNNYGDINWWNMLFGTYENPRDWVHTCGFDDPKEQELLKMLVYGDVHDEP